MRKIQIVTISLILFMFVTVTLADTNRVKPTKQYQYTVTVTNTAADIMTENQVGRDILIQNNDAAGIVYLNFSGTATASGTMLSLDPGDSIFLKNITNAISAIGSIASNANVAISEGK